MTETKVEKEQQFNKVKIKNIILKTITVLILAFLVVTTFKCRYKMYSKSNHPTGLDGYYYALQAKSFAENGALENPDIETGYYMCGLFAKFCGDPIKGVKLCDAVTSVMTCFAVFLLLLTATKNVFFAFLGFLLTAASPSFTLMGINYINNQIGLMFLMLFVADLIFLKENYKSLKRFEKIFYTFGAVLLFVLSGLSHKVTFVYSVFVLGIFLLSKSKNVLKVLWAKKWMLVTALSVFAVCAVGGVLFVKLHSPRFLNSFKFWNLPLSKHKMLEAQISNFGVVEIWLYYLVAWIGGIIFAVTKKQNRLMVLAIPVLFFLFWNANSDMGIRMLQNTVIVGIPVCVYLVWNLVQSKIPFKLENVFCAAICLRLLYMLFFTPNLYEPKNDPPYEKYKRIAEKVELSDSSLLIAHLGLNHVYTYYQSLRDCLNWNCDFEVKDNDVWRLAYGADEDRMRMVLAENGFDYGQLCDQIESINLNYVLIKEDLWQNYLKLEDKEIAETFNNWYNPHEARPEFIRKKRKAQK